MTSTTPDTATLLRPPASDQPLQEPAKPAGAASLTELSGWGASQRVRCELREPETAIEVARLVDRAGCIARGLGRSYGDPALNAGGRVLGMQRMDRYLAFDADAGALTCEAGVSLAQIIADFGPRGFFPMITPGTKFATVGGCIANDVHGKAHHAQGPFSACVESMEILLASGEVVTASRKERPDLFWGTFGGMGLLGIVLNARILLRRIETTYFRKQAIKANCLEAMLEALEEYDQKYPYSVAILDPVATGKRLGNGVLAVGDHATLSDLPQELAQHPLRTAPSQLLSVPVDLPEFLLNPISIRFLTAAMKFKQGSSAAFQYYDGFFYPLDMFGHWNRAYGRRGFTQYQFVIPFDDGPRRLREILTAIVSSGKLPFLNVLKRLGKASPSPLSFPTEGYTFAIDFPMRAGTAELCRRLDKMVLDAGGRIYLGKDATVEPDMFRAMYPEGVKAFMALRDQYDPERVFSSDLARRVGLT